MAIKTRSEAQERYTWNFTDIFPSDEAWEQALKDLEASLPEATVIQGTLGESAESMKHGLDVYFRSSSPPPGPSLFPRSSPSRRRSSAR